MILPNQSYLNFAKKTLALLDLHISQHRFAMRVARADRKDGGLYIKTELCTTDSKWYEYDFIIDMRKAMLGGHTPADVVEVEFKKAVEEYTKALDTHEG